MTKSPAPPEHDREARALIRSKLLLYKLAHDLGAPELTARIHDAEKMQRKVTLGISTVQRFLADKVWTTEPYVDMFERFTKDFPAPDPIVRKLIRKKLTRYMEENRIGVPALAKRITDANPEHEIQITTLQRFLTGHARTNEDYVALLQRFADSLT
jgi:hypothetical protein